MIETAFLMGLLGSLHCAVMCGPLMLGLSGLNYSLFSILVHHVGRWVGYAMLSLLFYFLISPLHLFQWQQYIGLISGVLLVMFGLKHYIPVVKKALDFFSNWVMNRMQNTQKARTGNVFLGVLNGLLPCGLSFAAAILSVNAGGPLNGVMFMFVFGLGTLPVLLLMSFFPKLGLRKWSATVNKMLPKLLVITGFLLIVRSAGLGIPYVSPTFNAETEKTECCHEE